MPPTDYPKEFEEDLIALDDYRNPRIKRIFPDPRLEEALLQQATAQFYIACVMGAAIFVALMALLTWPGSFPA